MCWKNGTGPTGGPDAAVSPARDGASADVVTAATPDALVDVKPAAPDAGVDQSPTVHLDSRPLQDAPGTSDDAAHSDVALESDSAVLGPDAPTAGEDAATPDAAGCPAGKVPCNGKCIDATACCVASDCTGSCMTCDSTNTCVPIKGQADPTGRCTGTCDSTGACKGKLGQACNAVGGGCAAGTSCSPEGICCDKACTDSCEACDATGTCKPLTAGAAPKTGHAACVTSDATCAGKCDGTSSACAYPTSTCGVASCNGSVYQAAGTCQKGTCATPAPQTCPNACVVASGGCSGTCQPNAVQCSGTGIPQKCSEAGAWVNQNACAPGFVCSGGACTCSKTDCDGACVDLQSDANNCGECRHSCQGGTCASGQCQAVVVARNLDSSSQLIGLDAQYLYYQDNVLASTSGDQSDDAHRIGKSATNGSGTRIYTGESKETFNGVVGSTYLLMTDGYPKKICSIASTSSCAGSRVVLETVGIYDHLIGFRAMAPDFYAFYQFSADLMVGWVSPTTGAVGTYTESEANATYDAFFSSGTAVYWVRTISGDVSLFATKASDPNTRVKVASSLTPFMSIIDANAQSVLLWDGDTLFRVPAAGASAPLTVTRVSPAPSQMLATEDAAGVYWFDGNGTLSRCSAASCSGSKATMATGQAPLGGLFQDETNLYWLDTSSGYRIMRIAK